MRSTDRRCGSVDPGRGAAMRTAAIILTVAIASALAQSSSSYRIAHTYVLGGDGGWDYIVPDPSTHRLFIGRQNRVMVVDEDNGTPLGHVTGIKRGQCTAGAAPTGLRLAASR